MSIQKTIILEVDFAKYKSVKLPRDEAIELLEKISEMLGKTPNDIQETLRYLKNFDEFYEYMRKKFKDYLAPPHKADDYIKGEAIVDKVKLIKEDDKPYAVIIFDRRISVDLLVNALKALGYEVEVKKAF
ncbi:hypothetical protein PYJP_09020 [Pyrofollis japonicus]|uniref:hypothetical protein n=1 Tax=Pyrofollis japonicus TaxID=3060460 RepID=UPI00295C2991|nr:hypothetical protein [Pyrofollis japonicus]BEP17550.1 hypothetical protein PYJP_09020 [Pyrofollis japonicus]